MTNWAQIFTGLLFYGYDGIHQVRTLVFDNYQTYRVPVNSIPSQLGPSQLGPKSTRSQVNSVPSQLGLKSTRSQDREALHARARARNRNPSYLNNIIFVFLFSTKH